MGVILSCKNAQGNLCRTSEEEHTGVHNSAWIPDQRTNGSVTLNVRCTESKTRFRRSGKNIDGIGTHNFDDKNYRMDLELSKKNGITKPLGSRNRGGVELFSPGKNKLKDENFVGLQPSNFFLVHSPSTKRNLHSCSDYLSSCSAAAVLGKADLDEANVGKIAFSDSALRNSMAPNVDVMQLDTDHQIFLCNLGLTNEQYDSIVTSAEKCAATRGRYNAYTYAKQTLGCRDNDELAMKSIVPTHVACRTILNVVHPKFSELSKDARQLEETPRPAYHSLTLDNREPHIVKYDTAEEQNQSLEMHTDKSDWTFLIALSEYGKDYEGGGTFFESTQTAYHLMKGQCLIFRGTLKHCGLKITNGRRFLLVGFLVKAEEGEKVEQPCVS